MRGDGRIYQRPGSSFWWVEYSLRGETFRESTKQTDEAKARKFLKRRLEEVGADRIGARRFIGPQQERVLVNAILDDLVAEYKLGGKRQVAREVGAPMQSQVNRLRDYFGAMRAMQVHKRHVNDFIATLRAEGKKNATINLFLQLLQQAYKVAVKADPQVLSRMLTVPKLDESDNVRKGKFSEAEAEAIFGSLPDYMTDVTRFAYETGTRKSEILKLKWAYLNEDAISVPATDCKSRKPHNIALTPELREIIGRRRKAAVAECDLIFHHDGRAITDYRHAWATACVLNGLGRFYCRDCRDERRNLTCVLDATTTCAQCGKKWTGPNEPKYVGRIFHDFRRSAAHELWKAGNTIDDCKEVTGHATDAMFKRYADLFSDAEKQARQRETQARRREWREAQREAEPEPMQATTRVQ
jgi:integrase